MTAKFERDEEPSPEKRFCLDVAEFPIYVLPPEHWRHSAMLDGMGWSGRNITQIRFDYLDAIPNPGRGLGVHSRDLDDALERSTLRGEPKEDDFGSWFAGPQIDEDEMDFVGRFLSQGELESLNRKTGQDVGLRRYRGPVDISGHHVSTIAELWEYKDYSKLLLIRMTLPEVEISMLGWDIEETMLVRYASRLEKLHPGTELLRQMGREDMKSVAAFRASRH
jgi:hypothetical protein